MKKLICSTMLLLGMQWMLQAQPAVQWQKNYGGNNFECATSVKQTSDGGYFVAGYTLSNNGDVVGHKGGSDFWVLKLNSAGTIVWKRIYGGSNDDRCYAAIPTSDGGYILAGTSNSSDGDVTNNKGAFDMWVVKLNSTGGITWKRNFGGPDDDAAYSIDELATGGYVIAGESKSQTGDVSSNKGGYDYSILQISASGSLVWKRSYGGSSDEGAKSIQQCSDGSFIVAGTTNSNDYDVSNNRGGSDFWVLRLRPNGTIRWNFTYGGTTNDEAYSVIQLSNGNFAVVGETESNNGNIPDNSGGDDFWVLSLRGSGSVLWSRTFGGLNDDNARFVSETSDGAIVVAGKTESNSLDVTGFKGGQDFWVIKVRRFSGNLEWQKTLGGFDNDFAYAIDVTSDGAQVVVGASESDDGDLTNNKGNADYWIAKLTTSGQRLQMEELVTPYSAVTMYPNPANSFVNFSYDGTAIQLIELFSAEGRLLDRITPNSVYHQLDVSQFQKGTYILKLMTAEGGTQTTKLIVN
jgi:hypothetical protein